MKTIEVAARQQDCWRNVAMPQVILNDRRLASPVSDAPKSACRPCDRGLASSTFRGELRLSELIPPEPLHERERQGRRPDLLQLGVLGFSLFVDGDVGVGVFPEGEKVFVGGEGAYPLGREVGVPFLWSRPGGVLHERGMGVSRQLDA